MRRILALALACAFCLHGLALARPFTIDDLLRTEQLGPVQMAPGGRWAIIQTFRHWDQAPRYDLDWWTLYGLGRLHKVDLRSGAVSPLLREASGSGYVAGPLSPSGRQMAVCRLTGHAWEVGVSDLATGAVHWLGLSPELPQWGREIAWRNDDELLVIAQSPNPIGHRLGFGWQGEARLKAAWAKMAAGQLSVTAIGSGRYRTLRRHASPKRLALVEVSTGRVRILASGDFFDLDLAPGGRTVAILGNGEDLQEDQGLKTTGSPLYRRRLLLADLDSGQSVEPYPACDIMQGLLSWSPKGDRLMIYARQGGDWTSGGFRIVDARTGRAAPVTMDDLEAVLTKNRNHGERAAAGWLGETPIVYARRAHGEGRADWYALSASGPRLLTAPLASPGPRLVAADAHGVTVSDGQALWRIGVEGKMSRLPEALGDILDVRPAPDAERLALAPPSPSDLVVRSNGAMRGFDTQGRSRLQLETGETPLAVGPGLAAAIVSVADAHGVERLLLRQPGHADRPLITLNRPLEAVDPPAVRAVHHKGPDGQVLTSWLFLPPGLRPDQRPPLVVAPYAGEENKTPPPDQALGSFRLYANAQVLAGAGYAVLIPSLPYAEGREPMDGLADQVLAVVDAAAAQAPVDAGRLAVWGHSYGGYTALALATQSPRFKAVIAGAPVSNLTSFYATLGPYDYSVPEGGLSVMGSAGWSESGQARMNGPPWSDPERYRRNSPIAFVDRIVAPVLLMMGDKDADVTQAEQMFTSLYRQDKDAVLLIYHGESHVVSNPANVRDEYARALAFLGEHIGPPAVLKPQ